MFDGVCVLCNGWVRFLLKHDRARRYRFAAMQSPSGRQLLLAHGLDPDDPTSFLLVDKDQAWRDSDALQRVLVGLGGVWRATRILHLVPVRCRDLLYRAIARNRYRWFGRHDHCYLPTAEQQKRFLS